KLTGNELIIFWPFLVNELLMVGSEKEPDVFQELCTLAASFPEQDMRSALPCLNKLDALAERKIAPDIFLSHSPYLHFLFRLLLESSQEEDFCRSVMGGLKASPLGWLDRAVLPFLDCTAKEDQQFIVKLFQQDNPVSPGQELKEEGAAIIIDRLQKLPLEQRKEQWVAESISALSRVRTLSVYSFLVEIAKDKQFLLVSKWPKAARLAALKALKNY
ncbi:MAG: hypothetical protein D3909_02265, partial [Candidatus Electrothrix sp. ATG1]|nr:hypothetical protein [Candidatus Electrothrix sp. ATG1]